MREYGEEVSGSSYVFQLTETYRQPASPGTVKGTSSSRENRNWALQLVIDGLNSWLVGDSDVIVARCSPVIIAPNGRNHPGKVSDSCPAKVAL